MPRWLYCYICSKCTKRQLDDLMQARLSTWELKHDKTNSSDEQKPPSNLSKDKQKNAKINNANQTVNQDHLAYVEKYNIWYLQSNLCDIAIKKYLMPRFFLLFKTILSCSINKTAATEHLHLSRYWLSLL